MMSGVVVDKMSFLLIWRVVKLIIVLSPSSRALVRQSREIEEATTW